MKPDDLIITVAYVWIPLQIVVSLCRYPRLTSMPLQVLGLFVLVALFFILCGTGHLMRALDTDTMGQAYRFNNWLTAVVSFLAALYSLPLVPKLISSLDQNLQELVKLHEETKASKQQLLTFMAFLCHEIRNPLFAITSAIAFLGEDELTEEQETTVNIISQSTELMLRLVNDVLDISKLESGKLEMEERDFDLRNMQEGVIATVHTQIKKKHGDAVQFRSTIAPDVPQMVCGDSVRLLQIAYNLLSNANKFTGQGFIEYNLSVCDFSEAVRAKLIRGPIDDEEDDHDETGEFSTRLLQATEEGRAQVLQDGSNTVVLSLKVVDTGAGISAERVNDIFQPYSQAKMSDYRKHGGTGLGLSIVSKLTRIMGGTIHVSSKEYEGSTFVVHLPLRRCQLVESSRGLDVDHTTAQNNGKPRLHETVDECLAKTVELDCTELANKLRPKFSLPPKSSVVLVVDDNCVNRKLLGRMLSNFNVEYELAGNGQEALDIIERSRNVTGDPDAPFFGLVLMDMQMPVMDGCKATEKLRARNLTLPIIALTANALDEWKQKALQAGATDYATKPILRDDLHAKCCQYLLSSSPPT